MKSSLIIFLSSDGIPEIGGRGVVKEKRSDRLKNSKIENNEDKKFLSALTTPRRRLAFPVGGQKIFTKELGSIA